MRVAEALEDTPVVCILGPRQCGKSTLVRHCDPERDYFSLDQRDYFELARKDPGGFIDQLPERVAIDEIQRVPELTLVIKRSVDAKRRPGRFLLTGSANLLQLPWLADSLAGRMECVYLQPFTESEKEGSSGLFKTPKFHFCDSGVCAMLADLRPEQWNAERTRFGHLLESFLVQQMIALGACLDHAPRFYHYRDKDQVEVDLVEAVASPMP